MLDSHPHGSYFGHPATVGKPLPQAAVVDRFGQPAGGGVYYHAPGSGPDYGGYGGYPVPKAPQHLPYYPPTSNNNAANDDFGTSAQPLGLPGASHEDLMGHLPLDGGHMMLTTEDVLDPGLGMHDQASLFNMAVPVPGSARIATFEAGEIPWDEGGLPGGLGLEGGEFE